MADRRPRSILDAWLHPLTVSEFRARYWTRAPYRSPAIHDRLEVTLAALPGLDLPAFLQSSMEPIEAWFQDDGAINNSLRLDRHQALQAYRAGHTLYGHFQPAVADPLEDTISQVLGCHRRSMSVSFFASRRGAITPPHVDQNHNFTIQVRGRKTWRLAAGLPWPDVEPQTADNPLLHDLFRASRWAPDEQEPHREELTPGAVLYCPPRYWHGVEADDDALSLNIAINTRDTWADVLLPALRTALLQRPEWRRPIEGLWSTGELRERARQTVDELLRSLGELAPGLGSDDFFAAWDGGEPTQEPEPDAPAEFVRNPLVQCEIVSATVDESFSVHVQSQVKRETEHHLTLAWECLQPFLTLIGTPGVQRAESFDEMDELIIELVNLGVLRPHRPE